MGQGRAGPLRTQRARVTLLGDHGATGWVVTEPPGGRQGRTWSPGNSALVRAPLGIMGHPGCALVGNLPTLFCWQNSEGSKGTGRLCSQDGWAGGENPFRGSPAYPRAPLIPAAEC